MLVKTELNTENILNKCAIHAKLGGDKKLSSFFLTIRKPFVDALQLSPGDLIDIAVLKVEHSNRGMPKLLDVAGVEIPKTDSSEKEGDTAKPLDKPPQQATESQIPNSERPLLENAPGPVKKHYIRVKSAIRGKKGKSRRGKGGKTKARRHS